jgi:hypothetical protein
MDSHTILTPIKRNTGDNKDTQEECHNHPNHEVDTVDTDSNLHTNSHLRVKDVEWVESAVVEALVDSVGEEVQYNNSNNSVRVIYTEETTHFKSMVTL